MLRSSLNDAAAVASAVCLITKRVIVAPPPASHGGPTRPWPTHQLLDGTSTQLGEQAVSNDPNPPRNLLLHDLDANRAISVAARADHDASGSPPPPGLPSTRPKLRPWSTQLRAVKLEGAASPAAPEVPGFRHNALGAETAHGIDASISPLQAQTAASPAPATPLDLTDKVSLPPQAPDGTYTEMKVVHGGRETPEPTSAGMASVADASTTADSAPSRSPLDGDQHRREELLRRLDHSLESYFGSAASEPQQANEEYPREETQLKELTEAERKAEVVGSEPPATARSAATATSSIHSASTSTSEGPSALPSSSEAAGTSKEPQHQLTDEEEYDAATEVRETPLRAAKVPSSRLGRLFHYGTLGAGLAVGTAGQFFRGSSPSSSADASTGSLVLSEQNVARLVDKLSTMRGAALKLGQFLSIQDTKMLPPQIEKVLLRVQNAANYMPVWQMNKVMAAEYGVTDWKERYFSKFDDIPFASASIGQVHSATLRDDYEDPEMAGKRVAVKVQFPGVLESIDSDLSYIRWIVSASALLPKGLFLDNSLKVMSQELREECDYTREAEMGRRFRTLLQGSAEFEVPKVVDKLSTSRVLVTEMMRGRPLTQAARYTQETRDRIAQSILNLALSELFRFRLMQTDPNWTNFLYNERSGKIQLIDFGATREYSKQFMDNWLKMLQAAIRGDHDECVQWSRKVGYLTGQESERMEKAHVDSMIVLGEPFRDGSPDPYPFESQTITDRVKEQIPLMLKERLTPPPQETYSLNRKLSGAFLLCARLKANVRCRDLFKRIEQEYRFGPTVGTSSTTDQSGGSAAASWRGYHTSRIVLEAYRVLEWERDGSSAETSSSLGEEVHKMIGSRDRGTARGRRGINLANRYPRSTFVASPDTVTTLSTASAAGSCVEAGGGQSDGAVDLSRKMLAAEVHPSKAKSPLTARDDGLEHKAEAYEAENRSLGLIVIRGITIPLKPQPPGPDECCMSGCAHCAYDIYAEDLEDFHSKLQAVRQRLLALEPPVTASEWHEDLLGAFPSDQSEASGEDARARAEKEVNRAIGDLDPTMKAFLEMERRLKKQERSKSTE
ncbi:hypothetical protein ACQY0O_001340 [Thecaphora frezii]